MERASFPQLGELQLEEMEMRTVGVEEALAPLLRHIRYSKKKLQLLNVVCYNARVTKQSII
jgi:hypothetical protein